MYIHKEGKKYILIATLILAIFSIGGYFIFSESYKIIYWLLITLLFLLWIWVLWFFRIPNRKYTMEQGAIIAPADGKVVVIEETFESEYFKDQRLQISIFMSPLNVHVNRSPVTGIVKYVKYHPGKYLVAWHPKSSTENERTTIVIENRDHTLLLRQIAGAVARRIKYYVKEGTKIEQNAEFGFIQFGSRVDIFLPIGSEVSVKIGDKVYGGITVLSRKIKP